MAITLYAIPISNPSNAARGMLAYKRLPYRLVKLPPGFHPWLVRMAGFPGHTVPALEIDGVKLQHSLAISRALDELEPEWPLFPADPGACLAVEAAEAWGEAELQHLPRWIFRWALTVNPALRRWLAAEVLGVPFPGLQATELGKPIPAKLAAMADANEATARQALAELPVMLDRVDELIADGVIGNPAPNAADFQILSTVCALGLIPDLDPILGDRPCVEAAKRVFPYYDGTPGPRMLPA